MTKLEQAANEFAYENVLDDSEIFTAGARWALGQMTSEAAVMAWDGFVKSHIAKTCSIPTAAEILAAVRKEIEG